MTVPPAGVKPHLQPQRHPIVSVFVRENLGTLFFGAGLAIAGLYMRCELCSGADAAPAIVRHLSNLLLIAGIGVFAYVCVLSGLTPPAGPRSAPPRDWDPWK